MLNPVFNYVMSRSITTLRPDIYLFINVKSLRNLNSSFSWGLYSTPSRMSSNGSVKMSENLFVFERDRYDGLIVNAENNHCSDDVFTAKLHKSIVKWKEDGVRGVWFNLSLEYASWVPILAKNGFTFHHAEGTKVSMTRWLPENETSGIPGYAHTMTGAGAIVVNSRNELLVVSEKYKITNRAYWKLPGGYIERGETIADAAIREVFEETGVKTKFLSLVAMRHSQGAAFGCCDAYFIVELTPVSSDSEKIIACSREIEACRWMKIEEYINHPDVMDTNKAIAKNYLECKKAGIRITGEKSIHKVVKRQQTVFMVDVASKT